MELFGKYLRTVDSWWTSRVIAHSRLPQVAAVIPTLGYIILWSDKFGELLQSSKLNISFSPYRLHFIWWGAILLLIGLLLYWSNCPRSVKRGASAEDYIAVQLALYDDPRLSTILKPRVKAFLDRHTGTDPNEILLGSLTRNRLTRAAGDMLQDPTRADLLRFEWEDDNRSSPFMRRKTALFMIVGTLVFLIPSFEVTLRVLATFLPHTTKLEELTDKSPEFPSPGSYNRENLSHLLSDKRGNPYRCSEILHNNRNILEKKNSANQPITSSILVQLAAATALGCDASKDRWP